MENENIKGQNPEETELNEEELDEVVGGFEKKKPDLLAFNTVSLASNPANFATNPVANPANLGRGAGDFPV